VHVLYFSLTGLGRPTHQTGSRPRAPKVIGACEHAAREFDYETVVLIEYRSAYWLERLSFGSPLATAQHCVACALERSENQAVHKSIEFHSRCQAKLPSVTHSLTRCVNHPTDRLGPNHHSTARSECKAVTCALASLRLDIMGCGGSKNKVGVDRMQYKLVLDHMCKDAGDCVHTTLSDWTSCVWPV
jgi:hypothetical protein